MEQGNRSGNGEAARSLVAAILSRLEPRSAQELGPRISGPAGLPTCWPADREPVELEALDRILTEHPTVLHWLKSQPFYADFKARCRKLGLADDFDVPGPSLPLAPGPGLPAFSLSLSRRGPEGLLAGDVSGDCTAAGAGSSFHETAVQFLLDPAFLSFQLLQEDGAGTSCGPWVGNVYTLAVEAAGGEAVLVIDAVQVPVPADGKRRVPTGAMADAVVDALAGWALAAGFKRVVLSAFVSNFWDIRSHLAARYPASPLFIEKLGSFAHLAALGLWDDGRRNEYLETFGASNAPLPWDFNLPAQTVLLRQVLPAPAPPPDP